MGKSTTFNLRIEPDLKAAAEKAAAMDQRSLAGLIVKLLTVHCHQVGTLKEKGRA
jgi:predicted HicB family RNase H-like nuclease